MSVIVPWIKSELFLALEAPYDPAPGGYSSPISQGSLFLHAHCAQGTQVSVFSLEAHSHFRALHPLGLLPEALLFLFFPCLQLKHHILRKAPSILAFPGTLHLSLFQFLFNTYNGDNLYVCWFVYLSHKNINYKREDSFYFVYSSISSIQNNGWHIASAQKYLVY